MEVLHAVLHRALVGPGVVVTTQQQGLTTRVHALGNLVVLDHGLRVGGLLRLDELGLERHHLFRVEEFDQVQGLARALREQ